MDDRLPIVLTNPKQVLQNINFMRYFLDTEFIEDGKTIDLISIGIVAEDGREFYSLNMECDHSKASQWVQENVLKHLPAKNRLNFASSASDMFAKYATRKRIAMEILNFCDPAVFGKPEFWAYYADYDWVVFSQLFGTMINLPDGFPLYCRDLKQECDRLGNPLLPEQTTGLHNALEDARWNKEIFKFLGLYERKILGAI